MSASKSGGVKKPQPQPVSRNVRISKELSYILRHAPPPGSMDEQGELLVNAAAAGKACAWLDYSGMVMLLPVVCHLSSIVQQRHHLELAVCTMQAMCLPVCCWRI
jgi:hypothetical protein